MLPSINGVPIRIYHIPSTAAKHEWRDKYKNREDSYTLLSETIAQPYFFNAEDMRIREGLGYPRSLGYVVMAAHTLTSIGISPAPDGLAWVNYRLLLKANGNWKTKYLKVTEARPRSPHRGDFRLWYIYFTEDIIEENLQTTENTVEEVQTDIGGMIVERVVVNDAINTY